MHPVALEKPRSRLRTAALWGQALAEVVWARRVKIATLLVVWGLAKSCAYLPEWAQPACEALVSILRRVPW